MLKFVKIDQQTPNKRDVGKRVDDFKEIYDQSPFFSESRKRIETYFLETNSLWENNTFFSEELTTKLQHLYDENKGLYKIECNRMPLAIHIRTYPRVDERFQPSDVAKNTNRAQKPGKKKAGKKRKGGKRRV